MTACTHAMYGPGEFCHWCYRTVPQVAAVGVHERPQTVRGGEPSGMSAPPATIAEGGAITRPAAPPSVSMSVPAQVAASAPPAGGDESPTSSQGEPGPAPTLFDTPTLFDPPAPVARRTDPSAAHDAARAAAPGVRADAMLLLDAHVKAGSAGLIGREYHNAIGRDYSQIGPRRPWLVDQGWIAPLLDETGKQVRRESQGVYVATDAGRAENARQVAA
jgi:hypothetical protein